MASTVTYEDLAEIEAEFEDLNVEMLRTQAVKERALYVRRSQAVAKISHFWTLVFEQAPMEIDQFVTPTDNLVFDELEDFEVRRFEADEDGKGDPRSLSFRFVFGANPYFEDRVIEKKFYYRGKPKRGKGAAAGEKENDNDDDEEGDFKTLISEPVRIRWKGSSDLTAGLLDLAADVYAGHDAKKEKLLVERLKHTALGAESFFSWFGYVGRREAKKKGAGQGKSDDRKKAPNGKSRKRKRKSDGEANEDEDEDEDEDDKEEGTYPFEIFPDGEELAVTLAEDVWPNAINYFRQAQEMDSASDDDFESDDEEDEE